MYFYFLLQSLGLPRPIGYGQSGRRIGREGVAGVTSWETKCQSHMSKRWGFDCIMAAAILTTDVPGCVVGGLVWVQKRRAVKHLWAGSEGPVEPVRHFSFSGGFFLANKFGWNSFHGPG